MFATPLGQPTKKPRRGTGVGLVSNPFRGTGGVPAGYRRGTGGIQGIYPGGLESIVGTKFPFVNLFYFFVDTNVKYP